MSEVRVMIVDDSRVAQDLFTLYINNSEKYELYGVRVQMSEEEAERQLRENGFSKLETGVFFNGVDRFVTLGKDAVYEENDE